MGEPLRKYNIQARVTHPSLARRAKKEWQRTYELVI